MTKIGPQIYYFDFILAIIAILINVRSVLRKRPFIATPFFICMLIFAATYLPIAGAYQRSHPILQNDPSTAIAYDPKNYDPLISPAIGWLNFGVIASAVLIVGTKVAGKFDLLGDAHFLDSFINLKRVELHIIIKEMEEDATFESMFELRSMDKNENLVKIVKRNLSADGIKIEFAELRILRLALRRLKSRLYQRPASYDLEIYGCTINLYDLEQHTPHTHSVEAAQYLDQIHDLLKSFPTVHWIAADQTGQ